MLGNLDEDLSCANSRLFRATLYANQDVSRFLREHFILYWSSERPVPRVTIDYGNGHRLERTTAGNSAHYVLDEAGHVLDVLPGLYAPAAFRRAYRWPTRVGFGIRSTRRPLRPTNGRSRTPRRHWRARQITLRLALSAACWIRS